MHQNKNKGFTLIEVLVAIFVLITAVVVPLTIGSKAFAYSNFVRDQSTASYLAQEAMEYVRLLRDNASLNLSPTNGAWGDFKNVMSPCNAGRGKEDSGCSVIIEQSNYQKSNIQQCSGSSGNPDEVIGTSSGCPTMFLQEDGTYTYDQKSGRSFVRTIQTFVEGSGTPLERMRVTVTLSWNTNGINERNFSVINYLTPWQI